MPDLSAYVDFSVQLKNDGTGTPKIVLTDVKDYTNVGGVDLSQLAKGYFRIIQPDGGVVARPNTSTYDVYYNATTSSRVSISNKELRLDVLGKIQNGTYTFEYYVECDGYSLTTVVRDVDVQFNTVDLIVKEEVDVFLPSIKVRDTTNYAVNEYSILATQKNWTCSISNVVDTKVFINTTGDLVDLKHSNKYYDAFYEYELKSITVYTKTGSVWFSISQLSKLSNNFHVYSPPTLAKLRGFIEGETFVKFISGCKDECDVELDYSTDIKKFLQSVINVYNKYSCIDLVHTNLPITVYDWAGTKNGLNKIVLPVGTSQWTFVSDCIIDIFSIYAPTPITLSIGTTANGEDIIDPTFINGLSSKGVLHEITSGDTIYFTGGLPDSQITIFIR